MRAETNRKRGRGATAEEVKAANRRFYDAIAERYEEIDGRRSEGLKRWLRARLVELREAAPGGRLLDIGSGSGLVARCADGIFAHRVGTDISPEILRANADAFDESVACDCDALPFADESFDAVTCFAVLHHLHSFDGLVAEVARVLRPGGVFYSDHDMDERFYRRFRPLLEVYRRLHNACGKYRRASSAVTEDMYRLSEFHETGIDAESLCRLLRAKGLHAVRRCHWHGLAPATDLVFGTASYPRGWAPLVSVWASRPA